VPHREKTVPVGHDASLGDVELCDVRHGRGIASSVCVRSGRNDASSDAVITVTGCLGVLC
jgi:hypothetical protein